MRLTRGARNMITTIKHNNEREQDTVNNEPILTVNDLSIATKAGALLVDKLSYQLSQGQTLAIVGESGSGKSIASLALLGLLPDNLIISGDARLASPANMTKMITLPIANNSACNKSLRAIIGYC